MDRRRDRRGNSLGHCGLHREGEGRCANIFSRTDAGPGRDRRQAPPQAHFRFAACEYRVGRHALSISGRGKISRHRDRPACHGNKRCLELRFFPAEVLRQGNQMHAIGEHRLFLQPIENIFPVHGFDRAERPFSYRRRHFKMAQYVEGYLQQEIFRLFIVVRGARLRRVFKPHRQVL